MAISNNTNSYLSSLYNSYNKTSGASNYEGADKAGKTDNSGKTEAANNTGKAGKTSNYGKTIGQPKLSEKAADYYEKLKKKYGNMDFILVSKDQKENAKANAAAYANPSKPVVLIDEEKIEKMATDENYRKQYEGVIENAFSGLSQLKSQLEASGANVKGFGIEVKDDGTSSFFAVLQKSSDAQKARIEKKAEAKKEAKKAEAKKAEKKATQERIKAKRNQKSEGTKLKDDDEDEKVTITANSIEELMSKISDFTFEAKADTVMTEAEKQVGQSIDFKG